MTSLKPLPDVLTIPLHAGPQGTVPFIVERLRRERPVAKVQLPSGDQAWLLTRRADITKVGTDRRFSRNFTTKDSKQPTGDDFNSIPGGIFNLDPPDHTRVRRIIQRFFSPAAALNLQPAIAAHAHRLITSMTDGREHADLMAAYAIPLALHMACEIMMVPVNQRRKVVSDVRNQLDWRKQSEIIGASTERLLAFSDEVIADKRAEGNPEGGPISALIQARSRDEISEQELRATVMYLFFTSAEPVTGPTCTGVNTLLRHPAQLRALREQDTDDLWDRAIWELLRYHHNGVSSLPRVALSDVEISGTVIRKGDVVLTPWLAASCDPEHYQSPDEFRLDRAPSEEPSVTFGSGPHFCLGVNVARVHLKTALRTLWSRLPGLTLAVPPENLIWEPHEFLLVRPTTLPITW